MLNLINWFNPHVRTGAMQFEIIGQAQRRDWRMTLNEGQNLPSLVGREAKLGLARPSREDVFHQYEL